MKKKIQKFVNCTVSMVDSILDRLDMKVATSMALVILGILAVLYSDQGTLARISYYGGSPVGYGLTSIVFGLILFRNPGTKAYAFLILPLVIYIVGFIELIWSVYGVPTPLVFYILCGLFLLKESVRR